MSTDSPAAGVLSRSPALLPGLLLLALLLWLFRETAASMVSIWHRSETFAHAFLVPPIALWLIWRRRAHLASVAPRSEPVVLLPMALVCALWLLGELAGVNAATQFALVGLIVLSVPAVFGWAVTGQLLFPLAFLFFAVPFGDFMVDPMMEWTADFTVAALRLSGVPVYREGLQFVIPSGNWSVVEACSGVRYLIASFMVGALFAYLNFNSLKRRLLFVLVSLLVPIVANWLRAYMIVMIGHLSGNKLAVGADHLLYGWVFFGIVIMIMFMIGARFTEPELAAPAPLPRAAAATEGPHERWRHWGVAAAVLALLAGTQATMWKLEQRADAPATPAAPLPAGLPGGWELVQTAPGGWVPHYRNASDVRAGTYRQAGASAGVPREIGVWIGHYRDQGHERKMVTTANTLVESGSVEWLELRHDRLKLEMEGGVQAMRRALVRSPADPKTTPRQRVAVLYAFRVGNGYVVGNAEARLQLALQRLAGRGDDSAVVFFFTEDGDDGAGAKALESFVREQLPRMKPLVDAARPLPR